MAGSSTVETLIVMQPIAVDTGSPDHEGRLVLANGMLVAILVRLADPDHDHPGTWFLEAGLGRLRDVRSPPVLHFGGSDAMAAPAPEALTHGSEPTSPCSNASEPRRASCSKPILPEAVRHHLGTALVEAYAALPNVEVSDPVTAAIARLTDALSVLAASDEGTFRQTLLTALPAMYRYAVSLTRNPAQAEDLVQDTLLKGWRHRTSFVTGSNQEAWLSTILRNTFLTQARARMRETDDRDGSLTDQLAQAPAQHGCLDLQDFQIALGELPEAMRRALVLCTLDGLTYEEAAEVMGCRVGTVKSRVWRARELLAKRLDYTGTGIGTDDLTLSALNGTHRSAWA